MGWWDAVLVLLRPDVVGLTLFLVAIFTLLSLFTGSRGKITGFWIDALAWLTGVGIWGVPLLTGMVGLWMVIRAIERMPNLPWQRPAGLALIFLAYITGIALLTPGNLRNRLSYEETGGWLGTRLADLLESGLHAWGAWTIVTLVAIVGLILLADRLLVDVGIELRRWAQTWWAARQARRLEPTIQPHLPLPGDELSWWERLRLRLLPRRVPPVWGKGTFIRGNSIVADRPAAQVSPRSAQAEGAAAASSSAATAATTMAPLTPHIVGGMQEWRLPRLDEMLADWDRLVDSDDHIRQQGRLIQETLALFGVPAEFEGAYKGPAVTQYLIKPGYVERTVRGEVNKIKVKVSKIANLSNDLALALAASSVRIEAPIPGTNYVGVEVPNRQGNVVGLKELMQSDVFTEMKNGRLKIALGEDVKGQPVVTDLTRMPHLLIAGATGSGKSICINSIVACLLCTHTPDTLRFLMIDPKMVELSIFNGIPHLLVPVVTDVERAAGVLFWAVKEMERRYHLFNKANTRDLERYNNLLARQGQRPVPYIVVIVDEMADLMMAAPEEVEKHICRLAQMARAVGVHLIIATQRPSVNVITGLIKANFPARIAFAVTSQVDSRVILDVPGAERLLGRGDMLFMAPDSSKLERLQGSFVSDDEINRIVRYWKGLRGVVDFPDDRGSQAPKPLRTGAGDAEDVPPAAVGTGVGPSWAGSLRQPRAATPGQGAAQPPLFEQPLFEQVETIQVGEERDALFNEAVRTVEEAGRGAVSLLQRKLRIGYGRASRLVDQLEEAGILGPDLGGSQGREVLSADRQPGGASPTAGDVGEEDEDVSPPPRVWM